jgi:uncharacterized protein
LNFVSFPLRIVHLPLLLAGLLVGLSACGEPVATQQKERPVVIPLQITDQTLQTEVARSPEEQQRGLMYRQSMPEDHGMIFVFAGPRQASFWMRNTHIPLSIAYLDQAGKILEIHDMKPLDETPIASQSLEVSYALEVNQGWFRRHGIIPGDIVRGLDRIR